MTTNHNHCTCCSHHCELSPSLLAYKDRDWHQDVQTFLKNKIKTIHFDVMSLDYVNNLAYTKEDFLKLLETSDQIQLDIHLMVRNPLKVIDDFVSSQTVSIAFHFDACDSVDEVLDTIKYIQSKHIKAGVAVNPNFKLKDYIQYVNLVDYILIMGVVPGKGGQKLILDSVTNLHDLYEYKKECQPHLSIHFDGGMNKETIPLVIDELNFLVAGSFLEKMMTQLKEVTEWFNHLQNSSH